MNYGAPFQFVRLFSIAYVLHEYIVDDVLVYWLNGLLKYPILKIVNYIEVKEGRFQDEKRRDNKKSVTNKRKNEDEKEYEEYDDEDEEEYENDDDDVGHNSNIFNLRLKTNEIRSFHM